MTLKELAQQKFKMSKYRYVRDFAKETGIPVSEDTLNGLILRNQKTTVPTAILICSALKATADEIVAAAKEDGDQWYWRLLVPVDIATADQILLERINALDETKRQLIMNMLEQLGG